jgi:hypothetical protein
MPQGASSLARTALGLIRILNGALGLFAPRVLIGRIDDRQPPSAAAVYAFRLFGVRTILIGRDLLVRRGEALDRALEAAPLIHASDTVTAALITVTGQVDRRRGGTLIGISALNTVLALLARAGARR